MQDKQEEKGDNQIIAEFMGMEVVYVDGDVWVITDIHNGLMENTNACFNTSWDWLMPVVEKIKKMRMPFKGMIDINLFETKFERWDAPFTKVKIIVKCEPDNKGGYVYHTIESKKASALEATYAAVIQFIKWYNVNK